MSEWEQYQVANRLFSRLLQCRKKACGTRLDADEVAVMTMVLDGALQTWDVPERKDDE